MNCRDARDLMLECVTGTVLPDRRRALVAHLQDCATCRREGQGMEGLAHLLRFVPEPRLPEGYWAEFMAALERRLLHDMTGWRGLVRLFRTPRLAWSAVAATSVLVVALGFTLLMQPSGPSDQAADQTDAELRGFVTESVQQSLPSMTDALSSWKAGFSSPDVSYELVSGGGR